MLFLLFVSAVLTICFMGLHQFTHHATVCAEALIEHVIELIKMIHVFLAMGATWFISDNLPVCKVVSVLILNESEIRR